MNLLRSFREFLVALMFAATLSWSTFGYADTLYKTNADGTRMDTATTAGFITITNYAEGAAPLAADIIAFNNLINGARSFDVSQTAATNLSVAGLLVLDPGGAITIRNENGQNQTLTIGASGINMAAATQNLTLASDTTTAGFSLSTVLGAAQIWSVRDGRTLTVSTAVNTGGNALTIQGGPSGAGAVVLSGNVTGGGALIINGMPTGAGNAVTLSGTANALGATTVGGGSTLTIDQTVAGNRLADAATLTLNRGSITLSGTAGGTETVGGVVLGAGTNTVTGAATRILGMGTITRSTGAVLNTVTAASATTTNANVNGILGGWAVINNSDFATSAFGAVATTANAETLWTGGTLNEAPTGNITLTGTRDINSLKLAATAAQTITLTGFTLNVTSGGIIRNQNATSSFTGGTLTAGGVANGAPDELFLWNNQSTMTIGSVIADNVADVLNVTKAGGGTVALTGVNTYTGITTIAAGTLNLGNNVAGGDSATFGTGDIVNHGTLVLNKTTGALAPQTTISNNISGSGVFTINRGTATLSGNNTYYGDTNVSSSTTLLAGSATGISPNSRMVLNAGTATLNLNGNDASTAALSGAVATAVVALGGSTLTLTGNNPVAAGAAQAFAGEISGATGNLVKNGAYAQTLTAGGALSYGGTTTINGGTLQTDKSMASSGVTVNGTSIFVVNVANGLADTAAVNLTAAGATYQVNGGFADTIGSLSGVTDSRVLLGVGANLTIADAGGAPTTFNGVISGAANVAYTGSNTWILGGGNSYTGATSITGGIVQLSNTSTVLQKISDRSAVTIGTGATLALNNVSETIGSLAGDGLVTLGAGRLTAGLDGTTTSFAGTITGSGGLTKVGNGTLTLTATQAAFGSVQIASGGLTLAAATPNTLASGSNVSLIGKGATLGVNVNQNLATIAGGQGSVVNLGPGATLTTGSGIAGSSTLAGATLVAGSTNVTFSGPHGLSEGALLTGTGYVAGTFVRRVISPTQIEISEPAGTAGTPSTTVIPTGVIASVVTGVGGLTKEGVGVLWLTTPATYTGTTTVNAGTLLLGGERTIHQTLSKSSALVVNTGGTVSFFGPNAQVRQYQEVGSLAGTGGTINLFNGAASSGVLVAGGDNSVSTAWAGVFTGDNGETGFMKTGTGALTLTGVHTYDGIFRVDQGAATISGTGRLDDAAFIVLGNRTGAAVNYSIGANTDTVGFIAGGGRVAGFAPYTLGGGVASQSNLGGNYIGQTGGEINIAATSVLQQNATTTPRVFGGVLSGAGTFRKSNTALLDLWGANTVANVTVDGGTLRLGAVGEATGVGPLAASGIGSLASTTNLLVTTAATVFDLNGASQTLNTLTSSGTVALGNGNLTINTLTGAASGNFSGAITGTGGVTVNATIGALGWELTGANTFTGPLVINGGLVRSFRAAAGGAIGDTTPVTVALGATLNFIENDTIGSLSGGGAVNVTTGKTLSVAQGNGGLFSGTLGGAGTAAFALNGGSMTMGGNNSIAGTFTVAGGAALTLDYSNVLTNNIIPGALTLAQSAVIVQGNSTAEVLTGVTLNEGGQSIRALVGDSSRIELGTITRNAGSATAFWGNAASTSTGNTASGILGGYAVYGSVTVAGAALDTWAVANGAGTAISGLGAGSYVANAFAPGTHTDITTAGPHAFNGNTETIRFNTAVASTVNIGGPSVVDSGGILVTTNVGNNQVTINGSAVNTLTGGAGAAPVSSELIIHQNNARGRLLMDVDITDSGFGPARLTKAGQGLVVLAQDTTYSGGTTITAGELQIGNGGAVGSISSSAAFVNNGILSVNRSDAIGIGNFMSGTGSFRQLGAGTTTLSGNNSYLGRTSVIGGTLVIEGNNSLGSVAGLTSVESGRVLEVSSGVSSITTGEIIALKGATLKDSTTNIAQSVLSGVIGLLGETNTITTATLGDELRITGSILGLQDAGNTAGQQPANLVIGGLGKTTFEGGNWYVGTTTIDAGATLALGRNTATGNLGSGDVTNNGLLSLDRSNSVLHLGNKISGGGSVEINRSSVYLAGDLSGLTGDLILPANNVTIQVYLGDHDFLGAGNAPGFNQIIVNGATANAAVDHGVRFSQADNFLTMSSDLLLLPIVSTSANRLAYFVKNNIGTLELTGQIAGEYAATSIDDRAFLQVNAGGGLLRITTDAASDSFLMGITGGVADPTKAFGGQIDLQGDTNQGRTASNWGYFEITGDADQTISANITGGGNGDQGGIFIYNSSGTLTLSPGTTSTSAADGNTLFNNRHQINQGTVILTGAAGGGAWRNDGFLSVGTGATLQINAAETTNVGVMKGGALVLNANYTQNGNTNPIFGGQITGIGSLTLNGNVTNRLYNTSNTFGGGLILNRGLAQFVTAGSLGTGPIALASAGSNEAENQLLQYVGLGTTTETVNNAINLTGTVAGRLKGIGSYGTGQLVIAGTVTVDATNTLILRGSSTGISDTTAPFAAWAAGIPTVSGQITGAGALTKDDAGAWSVTNLTNDFTGNVNLNNGRFSIPDLLVLGNVTKTINLGSGTGTPQWELDSTFAGGTLAATTQMNLSGTTGTVRIVNLGTGALTIADTAWTTTGVGAKTLALGRFDDVSGFVNVIEGAIVNSSNGATAITKDGLSTWRLNGVNTYTGATTVNNGILQLGNAAGTTLAANAAVTVVNAFGRGATLELATNESMGALTVGIGATVNLNGNTLTVGENNVAMTNNGAITGSGNLVKIGTGIMTNGVASSSVGLTSLGQNTYTGTTTISGGRIDTSTFASGGAASGFGASTNIAANLRINGANNVSDIGIRYIGTGPASTDRLFQISPSDSVTRTNNSVWASSAVVLGVNEDAIVNFTNTGDIGFTAASGAATLTLRGNEAGALLEHTFAPRIIDNPGGGATSLNKVEQGQWLVTNANTYTGTTTVGGGTLVITNNTALGTAAGGTTLSAGAAGLELRNNITVAGENATVTGDGAFIGSGSGTNVWTGNLILNQNGRLYAEFGSSFEITGAISSDTNARSLTFYDSGMVTLSGTNTALGATTVAGNGILRLNYSLNDTTKLADAVALTFGGTGLATLTGADDNNRLITRQVWATGGTLELATGAAGAHVELVSATTINSGSSRLTRTGTGTAKLRMNAITRNVGGVLDFSAANIADTDSNNINGLLAGTGTGNLGGWATVNKTDWATSIAAGAVDTNITALAAYNADAYAAGNNTDVVAFTAPGAPFTTNSIRFNQAAGGTLTLSAGNNNLQSGGILMTPASGAVTIGGGATAILRLNTTAAAANAQDLIIHQHSASDLTIDVQVGENITGANTQGLTKTGTGKMILTQDNTFRGTINLLEGTLQIGNGGTTGSLGTGGSTFNPVIFGKGATLILNTTKTTEYNFQTISGEGNLTLAATNTQPFLLDDDNNNFIGTITVDGGTLRVRGNNNALGNVRDAVVVNGGVLEAAGSAQTFANLITFNEGATLRGIDAAAPANTNANATFSGRLDFNNGTTGGMTVNVTNSTLIPGTYNTLTLSGIIKSTNGFTKTGNGILALSGQNIFDGQPTLNGQVIIGGGLVNLGNAFALGGYGPGNETVVQAGATMDLRGLALNFGDYDAATREIVQIAGPGFLGTGALRNTTGTGSLSTLVLTGHASVGGNATLDMSGFDRDVTPGVDVTLPTIIGGGFELTKVGSNDFRMFETTLTNISKFIVSEGEARAETRSQYPFAVNVSSTNPLGVAGSPTPLSAYPHTIFSVGQVAAVQIVYGGQTVALDGNGTANVIQTPIVGARLDLFREHGAHHTSPITAFGAASGTGGSYLELNSDTLPKVYTFWDGAINLTGLANGSNTFFNVEGGGAGLSVGDGVLGAQSPSGDQVVNPTSMLIVQGAITGTGGVTKIGSRELRLTGTNTFSGDFVVTRQTNNGQPIDPVQNEAYANMWSASLYGQGALSGTSNIVLERRGALRVINHSDFDGTNVNGAGTTNLGANLTNRINDSATIKLRDGFLVFDNGSTAVTETLGTVRPEFGDSFIAVNPKNGSNVNTTITIDKIDRQAGATLTLSSWDSTSTFGTGTPAGDDSVRFKLNNTTGLTLTGAATGTTDKKIAVGLYAGLAPLANDDPYLWSNGTASTQQRNNLFFSGRDFVTLDSGYLRPLDDSEYYTDTASMAGAAGQNLNLSLPSTSVLTDLSINSLRFGNLNDNLNNNTPGSTLPDSRMLGWQQTTNALTIDDGVTLTIDSGMILFANMGQGLNQDMQSYISGGTISFGANEGVISNINGWYNTAGGAYNGNAAFIRSSIAGTVAPGSVGITKTGFQEVYFDGINTYTGLTKVENGALRVRNSSGLGAGGDGNGLVIEGSGSIMYNTGINIGQNIAGQVNPSLAANGLNINANREDIHVGLISSDNQIFLRSNDSVNRHYGNITIDNVDSAGQTAQGAYRAQPRLFTDANTTIILAGTIGGGNTAVSQDTYYIDARGFSLDGSSGNLILQGSVGDKLDAGGNAVSVSGPVSNKPTGTVFSATSTTATTASATVPVVNTLGLYVNMPISGPGIDPGTTIVAIGASSATGTGTLTLSQAATIPAGSTLSSPAFVNENEVLRFWVGGSDHLNVEAQQQWKAVGRIELQRGFLRYTGTGDFYDAGTLALINASEAGNNQIGFQIGGGVMKNDPGDGAMTNFLLTQGGQSFGVNNWTITTNANNNQGAVMIGGENESGTVRFGPASVATPSTIALGRGVALFADAGGTVDVFSRFTGGSISKVGRGTVNLFGSSAGDFTTGALLIAGGELVLDYTLVNNLHVANAGNNNFNGGTLRLVGNIGANTTQAMSNANDNQFNIRAGGTEIVPQASTGRTTTLNIGRLVSATDGAVVARTAGGTANFVEFNNGGTSVITLAAKTGITSNTAIPYATYGTAPRQAIDFAMVDAAGNNVNVFGRAADEYKNDVTTWLAAEDVSENGGSGFVGSRGAAALTVNSVRFDANADSVLDLGTSTLTISNTTFAGVTGGALLVSSNVGAANKTITGGVLTTANTGELIVHNYGNGILNIGSQIGAVGAAPARVTVTGPTVTGAAQLTNWSASTTGQVVVSGNNSVAAVETKWNVNGSVLSISNENQLGKVDVVAATADSIYINGGALRWTGNQYTALDTERGITIGGGGAVIDVVDGSANLQLTGDIVSENWLNYVQTGAASQYVGGDLIKMGAGTLTLTGGTDASQAGFTGGIDVREGTLRINGNNTALTASGTQTVSILGDNRSALDGTVFRNGTNFEVYFGAAGSAVEWRTEEWLRFEGNNTIRIGTPGATNRTTHLNGVIDLAGDVTVDVVSGLTARFNQSSGGYMTGTGDVTKVGLGILEFRDNNVLWSGGLNVYEGTMRLISTGLPGGVGSQAVTLGSTSHQGIADLQMYSENQIVGSVFELYQDINVGYNPLQTKRISFGADAAAGNDAWFHGDVTLSDNVGIYLFQGGRFQAGTYNNMYFTGDFKDDIVNGRSGNVAVHVDDNNNGAANNQQVGEGVGYFVFRGNNSAWTGDLTIGLNQSWDQDEISVVRLENAQALTAVNDVTMNGSSKLQVAGNNVTIGSLISNNAAANGAVSTANDGLGNFQGTTGSSAWIENAGTTPGKITITQTTPVNTEALWDVHFQDGQLPSHVLDNPEAVGASLSVVKAGNGWATMTLDNDYTGTTEITGGVLQVGKNGIGDTGAPRLATDPGLTATAGGILAGTGVVQGTTVIGSGATLKPGDVGGDGVGTLTLNGNASLAVGSITSLQVKGASYNNTNYLGYLDPAYGGWLASIPSDTYSTALTDPLLPTQHDKVNVLGSLAWTVGSTINVVNNGYTPTAGDIFNLFDWFTIAGAVNVGSSIRTGAEAGTDLNLFTLGGDYRWDTSLFNSNGLLVVVAPGLIPEPSRMMLLLFGLLGVCFRRRRGNGVA